MRDLGWDAGCASTPSRSSRTQCAPELLFSAALGQEPEVEPALTELLRARAPIAAVHAGRYVLRSPPERRSMEE